MSERETLRAMCGKDGAAAIESAAVRAAQASTVPNGEAIDLIISAAERALLSGETTADIIRKIDEGTLVPQEAARRRGWL